MLTEAAARGEAVLTSQFAAISRNHTARISDLRADGHDIRCENAPTHLHVPGTGRQTQYRYIGNTREIAHEMFAVGHPLKSGPLVLRQYRNGSERGCLRLRPFATGGGISVLFDRPLSFLGRRHPGHELRASLRPRHILTGQDTGLSCRRCGFESRRGCCRREFKARRDS